MNSVLKFRTFDTKSASDSHDNANDENFEEGEGARCPTLLMVKMYVSGLEV